MSDTNAPKPGAPLTDKVWEVTYRDGKVYSFMVPPRKVGLHHAICLEQDRARLIGALTACINANYSPDVDNKCCEAIELLRELGELE